MVVISRPVTLLALVLSGVVVLPLRASSLSGLESNAKRCLQGGERSACDTALLQAETLARRASSRGSYPCQTLLLGLQADLIMQQLGDGRGEKAIAAVTTTVRGCAGL